MTVKRLVEWRQGSGDIVVVIVKTKVKVRLNMIADERGGANVSFKQECLPPTFTLLIQGTLSFGVNMSIVVSIAKHSLIMGYIWEMKS